MNFRRQIFVIVTSYLLSFLFIRGFLCGVKEYPLNNSARKKRKKGETFKEWFLYRRYRKEIPQILLILYFVIIIIHPLILIFCIIFNYIDSSNEIGPELARGIFLFDGLWYIAIQLLFWQAKPGFKYERWLTKKGGNRKYKK